MTNYYKHEQKDEEWSSTSLTAVATTLTSFEN